MPLKAAKASISLIGNALTAVRSYDNQYRLSYLKSGPFMKRNYGYDPNGNITGITDLVNAAKNQGFGYDAINRLMTATGAYGSLAYEYDAVGNSLAGRGLGRWHNKHPRTK